MAVLICPACHVQMKTTKIGQPVELMTVDGPYQLFMADQYGCPKCGHEVISSLGPAPISEHYRPEYPEIRARLEAAESPVVQYWANLNEKSKYAEGGHGD